MGAQIEPGAVTDAENAVMTLQGAKNQIPEAITDAVIETAKNRAHLLRHAHATVEFDVAPAVLGNQLNNLQHDINELRQQQQQQQQQVVEILALLQLHHQEQEGFQAQLGLQLAQMEVTTANFRIVLRNQRVVRDELRPLRKHNPGEGHDLAIAIRPGHAPLPIEAQNYHPNALIGAVPLPWNAAIEGYQHLDIYRLVIFYNDQMDINAHDLIEVRRNKVRIWLCDVE